MVRCLVPLGFEARWVGPVEKGHELKAKRV